MRLLVAFTKRVEVVIELPVDSNQGRIVAEALNVEGVKEAFDEAQTEFTIAVVDSNTPLGIIEQYKLPLVQ